MNRSMNDRIDAESKVSGNQANIPVEIRRALGINDGDRLRWTLLEDDTVRVKVRSISDRQFKDFDGYTGSIDTDVASEHDTWGLR